MNALSPTLPPAPSRLLRAMAVIASRLLWLLLGAWLLFGVLWGALHWFIVPRIGDFRPQLETQASKALGVPVTIGSITAKSQGMIPSFELGDVKLLDAQGQAALWLPKVMVALSPQSLVSLGFEQIYIERPELVIKRSKDGKITIAGLDFSSNEKGDGSAADWFFSQKEFAVRHGKVQWIDEQRDLPTLAMSEVDFVTRNHYRKHELRLDASLPVSMGTRVSAMATFTQPLLAFNRSRSNAMWQEWNGQIYTAFDRVDVAVLNRYVGAELEVAQGQGGLRAWADVSKGRITTATADVTLANMNVRLAKSLQPLTLKTVQGRLGGSLLSDGFEFFTQGLQFETQDGLRWPGGNVYVNYSGESIWGDSPTTPPTTPSTVNPASASQAAQKTVNRGSIKADKLDLAALSQIANRLPLGARAQAAMAAWAPKGIVETLDASWQGQSVGGNKYQVRGKVVGFEIAPINFAAPSVRGLAADFEVTQAGGKASIGISNGALNLPGIFDDPLVPLAQLSGDAQWTVAGERIAVQVSNLKFRNADAQGEAQVKWQTLDASADPTRTRFPGVLDLQGTLSRLEGTRVYRYLPALMRPSAREYVREAIQQGLATNVKFKAKGNIYDMPFADPKLGEFLISAKMNDAVFAYVPQRLAEAGSRPWPVLTDVNGELVIERLKLQVKGMTGRVGTGLQITKAEGVIADLQNAPTVIVSAEARGAASDALALVNSSPLGELINGALAKSTVTGNTDVKLKLNLPIGAIDKTTVQGSVNFAGSDFQFSPATPQLLAARGLLNFTERGFSLANLQGRMFGGDIALEGGSQVSLAPATAARAAGVVQATREPPGIVLKGKGTMTAQALRQMKDLGFISRVAQQASGSAAYSATLGFREGVPELQFASDLVGLALNLPAPLNKPAESALPIRFENSLLPDQPLEKAPALDQLKLDIGRIASISYVRDISGVDAKVLRGTMAVGLATDESAPMPAQGVVANVNMARLDLDAWAALLTQATGVKLTVPEAGTRTAPTAPTAPSGTTAVEPAAPAAAAPAADGAALRARGGVNPALGYLPNSMAIRTGELLVGGRKLTNLVVGGSREGLTWRANLQATELNGYAEYRQGAGSGAGRVYARLARVTLAQASAKDVESLMDEQPSSIPALDIIIDDLELRGKKLGRIEIEAINQGAGAAARDGAAREWRLAKFNVTTPEAVFTAKGNWADINAQGVTASLDPARPELPRRRTVMDFELNIADAGGLLARFGMKDVFRRGKGKLQGQVAWSGSPITPDYPSMAGAFTVNMEQGQFLKAEPGLAKLLGVLSLQSLPRRLSLDFRDVFTDGFSFDFVRGDVKIEQGIASTNNLQMKGVNAAVLMDGQADIAKETQKIRVIVVPEINAGTASLIAAAINPAIGLGTFLAQIFLRGPLIEAATQEFLIDGTWEDPQVTPVKRKTQSGAATSNEAVR